MDHRHKSVGSADDRAQPLHESLEEILFRVMVAVADSHSSGVPPDSRRQKQKLQACGGERGMLQRFHFGFSSRLNRISQQFRL